VDLELVRAFNFLKSRIVEKTLQIVFLACSDRDQMPRIANTRV
jgi:hypothetical protein